MTTSQKPEPGTAVSTVKRTQLSADQQAHIEARRAHGLMVQAIKGTVWAKEFDADTIRAVAMWARENDIDPVTEIHVLGGNIYIGARYFERVLSRLMGAGQIDYAKKDWVHVDKRIEKLADGGDQEMKGESRRRMKARIQFNIPDEADAACVYRVKHTQMGEEVTGAKWHVPGKKRVIKRRDGSGTFEVDADPVGDQFPVETIETRALRRCVLQLREAFPESIRIASTRDDDAIEMAEVVQANVRELKEGRTQAQITPGTSTFEPPAPPPKSAVPAGLEEDDEDGIRRQEQEMVAKEEREQGGLGLEEKPRSRSAVREGR
jgi:hypothetical protein